jgi:hypothetical protein
MLNLELCLIGIVPLNMGTERKNMELKLKLKAYTKANWRSSFIIAFNIPLTSSAIALSAGLSLIIGTFALFVFYSSFRCCFTLPLHLETSKADQNEAI